MMSRSFWVEFFGRLAHLKPGEEQALGKWKQEDHKF
jgi:hypothetical protein